MDCQCQTCQNACKYKPGWFRPGEVEKVADFLQISLNRLFKEKLAVDFLYRSDDGNSPVFVLSPATTSGDPGKEFPFDPRGQCVFYKDGKCEIHPVKPHDCRAYDHTQTGDQSLPTHYETGDSWSDHQDQIKSLLGRDPELPSVGLFDFLNIMT
jgi:Fe-S-cluster containining protein